MLNKAKSWINKYMFKTQELSGKRNSPTLNTLLNFLDQHSLGEILPYRLYDENYEIYINEGNQGLVFEATPLVGATEQTISLLTNIIEHLLPENSSIQFLLYASPKISNYLKAWADHRAERGEIFSQLAKERIDFLSKGARGSLLKSGDFPIRNFRLIISVSLEETVTKTSVLTLKDSLKRSLKSINIDTISLSPDKLLQLAGEFFSPDLSPVPRNVTWRKNDLINNQCAFPDTSSQITPNGLTINEDETEIRMYSVSKFPDSWPQWAMQSLIGDLYLETQRIRCPFFLSLSVHIPNQAYEASSAAMKSMRANHIANSPAVKYVPEVTQIAEERRFLNTYISKGGRVVKVTFQVGIISEPKNIVKDESVLESLFVSQGWRLFRHRYIHAPMLLACLPMVQDKEVFRHFQRFGVVHTLPSNVVANIAPLQGELKGMKVPRLMLTGKRGQLFWFDPFSNESGNYNVCITGKSGSGKSVFMQELAHSIVGSGGRLWIIDVGRSYERTCKLIGGEFIEFGLTQHVCLNPFTNIKIFDEDQLSLLKPIIEQMIAPNDPISDIERVIIEEALQQTWIDFKQTNNITKISKWLCSNKDPRAQDLGKRLYPYTEKGVYGRYFNGPSSISFDNPFLVLELEELKNKGEMQSIVLMLIIFQITTTIYGGDRSTETACFIDEAWQLLRGEKIKEFIENMARRARKYNASLITGTQSIQDYFDNPAAQAIYNNSDYTIILSQLPQAIDQLKKDSKFALDPHKEQLLKGLSMRAGEYADIFIQGPDWYAVNQLILDDFTLALYSTKGEQFYAVQQLQKQGKSLIEAVRLVAKAAFNDR